MRRVRPAIVVAVTLAACLVAALAVLWSQGDFWRSSAANFLRARLAAELGAEFQTSEARVRWFPPALSLGGLTLHRPGEPWVLTAEDVRVSFNLYAALFGRERLGRVVIDRPRLFVRLGAGPDETRKEAAPQPGAGAPGGAAARLRSLLRPPLPLRVLEVSDGRIETIDREGRRTVTTGVDLAIFVSRGSAHAVVGLGGVGLERDGRRLDLGRFDADLVLEEGRATFKELIAAGGPVAGRLSGSVTYEGGLALSGTLTARLEELAAVLRRPALDATGKARFEGELTGSWRRPAAAGGIVLSDLVLAGSRWPEAKARITWGDGRLIWSQLQIPLGSGAVSASGEVDFSTAVPRYRIDAEADDADLSRLPAAAGAATRARKLSGVAHWEGSGFGAGVSGKGQLSARFALDSLIEEEISLEAEAALGSGGFSFDSLRLATSSLEAAGAGSWSRERGLIARVGGTVGDLRRLFPSVSVPLGGRGSFEGVFGADEDGPRFTGAVRLAAATVGILGGLEAAATVVADAGFVRVSGATFTWPGGSAGASGAFELPSGRVDLAVTVERLSVQEAARILGTDLSLIGGEVGGRLRVRGSLAAPEVEGEAAGAVSYRATRLDEATLSFTYAARRLGISALSIRRGGSRFSFRGEVREGSRLSGEFEAPAFDLADFVALSGLELAGSLRGRVGGTPREPQVEATVRASRLRCFGFDFKGGELAIDYRAGKAGVKGWIAEPENALRLVVEPARDWRFESDLSLRQFAPELVHSGAGAIPKAIAGALGRATFLAAGHLGVRGHLRDLASVRAELDLDTLWLQAAGKTLQNRAPVRVTWRDGALAVEAFSLAGDQYHLDVSGRGSLSAGWGLRAAGTLDLAVLMDYWPELEDAVGVGDLQLTISGPWAKPTPEGSLEVREAHVRVRLLPEPLEGVTGRLELRGRTVVATGLSGKIGDGEFHGSGSYDMAADLLNAEVEGRLDLGLFRGRLPAAREVRGPVEVRLRLAGPVAAPSLSGRIDILDAELLARPFPAKFTHLRGRIDLGNDSLDIRDLSGQTGGGSVRLSGTMDWSRIPTRVDAELEGSGIVLSLAGALKAQSDLHLGLHGDFKDLRLAGEVRILKARYQREFGEKLPPLAASSGTHAGSDTAVDLSRMRLDVKVRAADNVWIANRMAKIEAAVALDIGGTLGAPLVRGDITAIQGEANYLSRQFRLESGSLRFTPPATVPQLEVQASTTVGETQILFLMDGPLNHPSYHLTSLPAMSQEDLVALLTIGETRAGVTGGGERSSLAGAAVFTTEPLVNALGDEVRSATGLETLQLEPVVGTDREVSARITLGTHLSDRLFVSYSQNLGATEDQQFTVQYSLLDYLSVWGQELRQGVYSLDLVFRYSFR